MAEEKELQQFGGCRLTAYPTPEAMQQKVDEYFDYCIEIKYDPRTGRNKPHIIVPPTMSGLARYLGFSSRAALMSYQNKANPLYEDVINDARLRIEEFLETELVIRRGNTQGLVFALKNNAKWEETTKTQLTGEDDKPLVFGWAANAADVIDIGKSDAEKKLEGVKALPEGGDASG